MKVRLVITACFALLLGGILPAFGENKLEIILEGPWILYQDHSFLIGTKKVHVLIAMTPGITKLNPHKPPSISSGDGYWIKPGFYCVGFDQVCALERPAHSLSLHDLSQLKQLQSPARWNWYAYNQNNKDAIFLILPMPDSLRNAGVYHMRFGKQFGKSYGADEQHSIGVVLHYDNGPQQLALAKCAQDTSSINGDDCKPWSQDSLDNTDTLEIVMKAPEDDNACDLHVRSAYPKMLDLIGGRSTYPDAAFIDPAIKIVAGEAVYASDNGNDVCYQCDTQDPNYDPNKCPIHDKMQSAPSIPVLLSAINQTIAQLENKDILPPEDASKIYVPQMREQFDQLDKDYPNISQLLFLKLLLSLSSREIEVLLSAKAKQTQSGSRSANNAPAVQLNISQLTIVARALKEEAGAVPTKTGGDCRAAVLLVR